MPWPDDPRPRYSFDASGGLPRSGAPATLALILANVAVFGLQLLLGDAFSAPLALWPIGGGFEPWQIVTSAFLHGSLLHIGANMYGLWLFGRDIERVLGSRHFLQLYAASVVAAAVTQVVVTTAAATDVPTLGASGGVFGVLYAFAKLFPDRRLLLLFPPIVLPARIFVLLYAAFELLAGISGSMAGVAHFAHLGGLAGAWLLMHRWYRRAG